MTLPTDPFALYRASFQNQPGRTWYIDQNTNRIVGEVDGYAAVKQAVEIILRTQRFKWLIYSPSSGMDYRGLVGLDMGYVAAELQRRVKEALYMDSRVTGVKNYDFYADGDKLSVSFTVTTVFGDVTQEVSL